MTEKKEHPEANVLRWIADGETVQWENDRNKWCDKSTSDILLLLVRENASDNFRIKPKTTHIGKYDVTEPMREEPDVGIPFFFLDATADNGINTTCWSGHWQDENALKLGMAWLKKEDALLAAKAIKELLTGQ